MIRLLASALLALLALMAWPVYANWCAAPGRNGTATLSGVLNTYFPGAASAAAGATTISIGPATGAAQAIAAGDLLLVIQMQDATINSSNNSRYGDGVNQGLGNGYALLQQTGRYEYVRAANAVGTGGGSLTIVGGTGGGLTYAYNHAAASATGYRRSFQVVKVPQYDQATIAGTVSALPWNGSTGGVVALDVARRLTFSGGTISASGAGFRGGGGRRLTGGSGLSAADYAITSAASPSGAHASKGEGIVGTPRYVNHQGSLVDLGVEGLPGGSLARGAPGNAGGGGSDGSPATNEENSGGGGGGNAGAGGLGGHAWCATGPSGCQQSGGHNGVAVAGIGVNRIVMGGGGGAGTNNNGTGGMSPLGFASSGAAGGGIVLVRAAEIAGTGSIAADGADAYSTTANDASGGGGAGGSVLLSALRLVAGAALSASANGGDGGSNSGGGTAHGPGGGGGGGFVAATFSLAAAANGGNAGTTVNGGAFSASYGAEGGSAGQPGIVITGANIPGLSSGGECTPTVVKSFASSPIGVGATSRMSVAVTNNNPTTTLASLAFIDTYPTGLVNGPTPAAAASCGSGSLAAAAAGGSFGVSGASIAAGATCTFSVTTRATSPGDKTNVIAAGGVTGLYGSTAAASLAPAEATIQVSAPLTIVKASQAYSDPVNGTASPKAIPGGFVSYTVTVANPGTAAVDTDTIVVVDATPAALQLFVNAVGGGTGPLLFQEGATPSGLSFSFAGLASLADDIDFSNDGGTSWTYVPVPNAAGVDTSVTHFRVRPKGAMAASSSFTLQFRYQVR